MTVINNKHSLFFSRCDQVTAGAFYALIFFLPIAPAFVESFFGVIIFTYMVKRSMAFYWNLTDHLRAGKKPTVHEAGTIFLRSFKPVESYLNRPIAVYTLIAFLTIFISYNPLVSLKGFFFKLLQGIYFYFLLLESINSKKRLFYFFNAYLSAVAIVVMNGVIQYFWGEGLIHHYLKVEGRISSCMKHPNELAVYLVLILPFILMLIKSLFMVIKKNKQYEKVFELYDQRNFKIFMSLVVVLVIFCLGVTYSRGGWIALLVSLIFLYLRKPKVLWPILICVCFFVIVFSLGMIKERTVNTAGNVGIFTISGRSSYWYSAWQVFVQHPIMGVGINAYSSAVKNFEVLWKAYPHNGYLHMAVELGVLGLGAFLMILYRLYKVSLSNLKEMNNSYLSGVLLAFLAGFSGFLFHSSLDTFFYSTQLGNLLWIIIGLIVAIQKIDLENKV